MKTKKRKAQIAVFIEKLKRYEKEPHFEIYSDECFINDVLYFLGLSFDSEYEFLPGYHKFLKKVRSATRILPKKKS